MVKRIGHNFLETTENVIASYNYSDIADATGYVTYFGVDTEANTFVLSKSALWSRDGITSVTFESVGGEDIKRADIDFDIDFVLPQRVKGDLLVNIAFTAISTGIDITIAYVKVRIFHFDGTETEIGTQQTAGGVTAAAGGDASRVTLFSFAVDRHFKKGDTLRINVELWGSAESNNATVQFYHDGVNRNFGFSVDVGSAVTVPSTLRIDVPFKIDL